MKHLILLIFILTGCVTVEPGDDGVFQGFPKRFTALQALIVNFKGKEETVIASLRREDKDYRVTFLHAAFQTPLLELKTFGPENERTRYFVDKERLPFAPKMVLDSIVSLYEATSFQRVSAPAEDLVIGVHTDGADYRLAELESFDGCLFPRRIDLTFNATASEQTPQVLPRLRVETKDLECK